MRIVVLAGGTSTERAISIVSGTGICTALREKGHQAILVDVFGGTENVDWENPFPEEYDVEAASAYIKSFDDKIEDMKKERKSFFGPNVIKLCELCDIVFLGLHGANGEDGKVQAAFDLMGIKYTGTGYLSSALAMDKGITKQMFRMNGVPTPAGTSMEKAACTRNLEDLGMEFPVVVKTCCGCCKNMLRRFQRRRLHCK
nr:D_ala_D_alaTIGR: D-alanine--D-alanine [uncultured bacterium]